MRVPNQRESCLRGNAATRRTAGIEPAVLLEIDGVPVGEFTGFDPETGNFYFDPFFGGIGGGGGGGGGIDLGIDAYCLNAGVGCQPWSSLIARCAVLRCKKNYCSNHNC